MPEFRKRELKHGPARNPKLDNARFVSTRNAICKNI